MESADNIFSSIEKLLNLGVPVAMLIVIVWLTIKYSPGVIAAVKGLSDNLLKNTNAVDDLGKVYEGQGNKLNVVTEKIQGAVESLGRVESKQVKMEDFNRLYELTYSLHQKLNSLYEEMEKHAQDHKDIKQ